MPQFDIPPLRIALTSGLLFLALLSSGASGAAPSDTDPPADTPPASGADAQRRMIDGVHDSVENFVQDTVRAFDSFFVDDEFATFKDNETRIRVRLNTDYLEDHGWEISPKLKINLVLPGLGQRLRLVVNDDAGSEADESTTDVESENDVALRWIGRQNEKSGISFDLGLRIKSGNLDPFGRVNAGIQYPLARNWAGQSTNRLYYYSETGWRNDYRQYFNRPLGDTLLFRSRTRIQYFEENTHNPFLEQKFSLFHSPADRDRKFAYEAVYRLVSSEDSPFDEDEIIGSLENQYHHYLLQMRYRQRLFIPWFYVEVWPFVGWPEEREYQTSLGARFRLEVNFGGSGDSRLDE